MLSTRKSVECVNSCFYMQTVLQDRACKEYLSFVFRIQIFRYRRILKFYLDIYTFFMLLCYFLFIYNIYFCTLLHTTLYKLNMYIFIHYIHELYLFYICIISFLLYITGKNIYTQENLLILIYFFLTVLLFSNYLVFT